VNAPSPPPSFTVTHRRVLAIAVPMTLASATTPLLGIVATAAIGRLGEAHLLGAVAMASVVFDCLFWLFGFLRMGTVALTAQALGARDLDEERATLIRALWLQP
jgi:MATE family multidrug resistance protein